MVDKKLTEEIEQWLNLKEQGQADTMAGAGILLRINRNKAMYQNITRNPQKYADKVEYELRKHVAYRKDGLTLDDAARQEKRVLEQVREILRQEPSQGIRLDHDKLPEEIQALWTENAERWKKMKQLHETCKGLTAVCDRYEYVRTLKQAGEDYKATFERYDNYSLLTPEQQQTRQQMQTLQKQLANARAYISKNLDLLSYLESSAEPEDLGKASYIRNEIQERIGFITANNSSIYLKWREKLLKMGFTINATDEQPEGDIQAD